MFDHEVKHPRSPLPMVLGGVALLAVVLALTFVPISHPVPGSCTLSPAASVELKAAHAGTLASVDVAENAAVEQGDVLATWDTTEASNRVTALEPELASVEEKLQALDEPGKKRLVAAVDRAEAAAASARAAVDAARQSSAPELGAAEKKAAAAEASLAKARAAAGPSRAELEGERARLTQELAMAKDQVANPKLLAPAAGLVTGLKARPSEPIAVDAVLLRVDRLDTLKATVMTNEESLQSGMKATLSVGEGEPRAVVLESGGVATLENRKHSLKPGMNCTAQIEGAPHPFIHF